LSKGVSKVASAGAEETEKIVGTAATDEEDDNQAH
jgi:hypothetical protein